MVVDVLMFAMFIKAHSSLFFENIPIKFQGDPSWMTLGTKSSFMNPTKLVSE